MSHQQSLGSRSTERRGRSLPLFSALPFLALGWTVGCGDDDNDPGASSGRGGSAGSTGKAGSSSKAGSTGKGGSAGKGSGGDAGQNSGGSAGKGNAGSGGSSAGSGGTSSGSSGEGGSGNEGGELAGAGGEAGGEAGGAGTAGTGGAGNGESGSGGEGGGDTGPIVFPAVSKLTSSIVTGVSDLRGLVFAHDGKVYASGHFGVNNGDDPATGVDRKLAIVRFNANGTLDTSFGDNGVKLHNLVERTVDDTGASPVVTNNGNEESLGIVELADGKFLLTANARDAAGKGTDVLLVKILADGDLDAGFGTGGKKRLDFGWVDETDNASWPTAGAAPSDAQWGLRLDPSSATERAVVFGFGPAKKLPSGSTATQRTDNDRYVARVLTSDGSLDPSFNGGAVFTLNSGGTFSDGGRRGIVLADGSILSAGYTNFGDGLGNHILPIRLEADGTPDPTFRYGINLAGVSRYNPFLTDGGVTECYQVGRQSTGRFITTGYGRATATGVLSSYGWASSTKEDMLSVRLLPNGSPDTSFGVQGTLAIQSEEFGLGDTEDRGRDLIVLPDDRIVYAGRFGTSPAIFVVKPDGVPDEGSGTDGRLLYDPLVQVEPPLTTSHFFAIAKSADSRTIVASTSNHALGSLVAFLSVAEN